MSRIPFSTLFNLLLDNVRKPNDSKYMLTEIAEATELSTTQLSLYKRKLHNNPTIENATAILDFFDMPVVLIDCESEVEALNIIHSVRDKAKKEPALPPVRFRNPEGLSISDEAMYQVKELLSWVFAREEALKNGDPEPPLPDFSE